MAHAGEKPVADVSCFDLLGFSLKVNETGEVM
jgi:hypothetical protein